MGDDLVQLDILGGIDHGDDEGFVGIEPRRVRLALPMGRALTVLPRPLRRGDGNRNTDPRPHRRRPGKSSDRHRVHNPP